MRWVPEGGSPGGEGAEVGNCRDVVVGWFAGGLWGSMACMGSRKPSAKAKQVAAFKSQLVDLSDSFAREETRRKRMSGEKEAALRKKACESKNRYSSRSEALIVIEECAEHGTIGLHAYRCPYCDGWHLTSKPPRD